MERESFEDEEIAQVLNQHFVSIKVDREERPDVDHIYMTVCQAMTGHGGWPLTVVMTPAKEPFFSGTYFPKTGRGHIPGLRDILLSIDDLWKSDRNKVLASGERILKTLESHLSESIPPEDLSDSVIHDAFHQLEKSFDPIYGGFGRAPKFPTPQVLFFLLRYWKVFKEGKALEMVEKSLQNMFKGGIYDHIGYGFARYSTDVKWLVPHFEKMLYDNALLAIAYLETFQDTQNQLYAEIGEEILTYVQRDMLSPHGAFYSAEDADSEGVEGKFYLWDPEEVKKILGEQAGEAFCRFYDISQKGNFAGKSITNLIGKDSLTKRNEYLSQRQSLFSAREKRIHPFKDDKTLTSWNGLMIAAFSLAARVLGKPLYGQTAATAARFILKELRQKDGRLLARYREGEAAYPGYIDDYAFFIWGLIELYQATFETNYLREALNLSQGVMNLFWDEAQGGCFLYGNDGEKLIARPKEIYDGASPSGNSVMALNFLRLARLSGQNHWEEKAERIFQTFGRTVKQYPPGYCYFLMAYLYTISPSYEIILTSKQGAQGVKEMLRALNKRFLPHSIILVADKSLEENVPFIKDYHPIHEKSTAYVCRDFSCHAPTNDINEMMRMIEQ
ncbi:hypothetical protein DCMF_13495 [Candidatus Formimonas warabiya]|uniref:Spermatogenesis-associated protein 20-like TRX domain-containing protein n=1 Tax=Formimonas warabiya TaxID=1761012 RepID=A0A3G1KT52_FORW1|nr:hypothetical protein DCMF_13495 [Candidatus Formimonas warabiya]